ncbi:hypothetical protein AWL63_17200 [Sphingomonas panacis]|uniref:Uncharacterized protein n=1 Tax=Sphingomonas panacis TaxID=1560345 RepID=A0A1B3ZHJ2_9SPHN|nr:hypothetical protein [Sphingomonas panacis]AOH86892.1 hypothetical protein AWL63_17200 [Sphingomonas panacis]
MTPPDLSDPAQRAAYARELRAVARPVRLMGVALAVAGALLAALQRTRYPAIPTVLPLVLLSLGALHMLAAVAVRLKYHQRRMKGDR